MRQPRAGDAAATVRTEGRPTSEFRFGLDGQPPRTLDEVSRTFNLTRERIRQIENQSIKKLRTLADVANLRDIAA